MSRIGFSFNLHPLLFIIIFIILCGITFLFLKLKNKNSSPKRLFILGATIFYFLSVFKLTILPITIRFDKDSYPDISSVHYYQLVPFETIMSSFQYGNPIQVFGNLVMLLPLPILLGFLRKRSINFISFLKLVTLVSLGIEFIQLLCNFATDVPNKVADVDDLILNVLGGILGWILIRLYFVALKVNTRSPIKIRSKSN